MNVALVLAGGIGNRVGAKMPKQFIKVKDQMIFSFCLRTLYASKRIDGIQIVAHKAWHNEIYQEMRKLELNTDKFHGFSSPGETRQMSIFQGITDIRKYADDDACVLIHDAVRPFLTQQQMDACLDALPGHDAVMPVLPMKDMIYRSVDGCSISEALDRESVFAGQSPEVFLLGKYYAANQRLLPERILKINGSTEPAVLSGMDIVMIPGDERNFKITTMRDLERFKEIIGCDIP